LKAGGVEMMDMKGGCCWGVMLFIGGDEDILIHVVVVIGVVVIIFKV
jgi:hypothetical protein